MKKVESKHDKLSSIRNRDKLQPAPDFKLAQLGQDEYIKMTGEAMEICAGIPIDQCAESVFNNSIESLDAIYAKIKHKASAPSTEDIESIGSAVNDVKSAARLLLNQSQKSQRKFLGRPKLPESLKSKRRVDLCREVRSRLIKERRFNPYYTVDMAVSRVAHANKLGLSKEAIKKEWSALGGSLGVELLEGLQARLDSKG